MSTELLLDLFSLFKEYLKKSDLEDASLAFLELLQNHNFDIHKFEDEDPDLNKALQKILEYTEEEPEYDDSYDPYDEEY